MTLVFVFLAQFSYSQTSSSSGAELKDIQNFKDKLASKVAELEKKNQRAIAGFITDAGKDFFKIKTSDETIYQIKIDKDLTKFFLVQGNQKKEIALADIKKDSYIIATGPIDNKTVSANDIYQDEQYLVGSGKITEANKTDFFLKILTPQKDTITLDIETSTKKNIIDIKTLEIQPVTLSKIKEGDTVHFAVKKTGKEQEKNKYSALKILVIPQEYFIK